ncbi:MAG: glycosyltransferase family 2 protein [Phycisphaerae bacterium]|nr:glycosyltransferase family 2 protein [Tepidisphaeraceae bacterium]
MTNLLIVILNYRTPRLTVDCLRSLQDKLDEVPGTKAIVVENGSADGSADTIARAIADNNWSDWAELLALADNRGFAGGNNAALDLLNTDPRFKETPWVLLLNSDTLIHPGALRYCHEMMQAEPTVGVMSCQLLNADGSLQNVTRDFPTPVKQAVCSFGLPWTWPRRFKWADIYDISDDLLKQKRDVDWLGGAFMFMRRTALDQIGGGLDHSFFFYGEDIEFCHRFHKHGWRVHYDPTVAITHIGGSSSDPTRVSGKLKNIYMWQARYQVQKKCYGHAAAWLIRGCDVLALGLKKAKMLITGKRRSDPDRYKNVSDALAMLLKPLRV